MLCSLRAKTVFEFRQTFVEYELEIRKENQNQNFTQNRKNYLKSAKLAIIRLKKVFSSSRGGGLGLAAIGSQTLLDPTPYQ